MARIRVLLIVDDYYSRYAFYSFLSKDSRTTVIEEARDVEEAGWLLETHAKQMVPDVILFDADFCHGPSHIEVLDRLMQIVKGQRLQCKVVCCCRELTLEFIRSAIEIGADGVLVKDELASRVADAVEKVYHNAFVYTRSVSDKAFGRIQGVRHGESYMVPPSHPSPLDRKLRRVARLYCENGLPAREIAEILHVTEAGVRAQIQQIYRILGVHGKREAWGRLVELERHG